MILPNELRIGNWVYGMNTLPNQIKAYDYEHSDFDVIKPIPLTPEILGRAGFEYDGATTLSRDDSPLYFKILAGKGSAFVEKLHQPFEVHCEYLHQLQNLYFAMTGEELSISL